MEEGAEGRALFTQMHPLSDMVGKYKVISKGSRNVEPQGYWGESHEDRKG